MAAAAAYDEIADWYEDEFLAKTAAAGADTPTVLAVRARKSG
jgi:hypothetical protein